MSVPATTIILSGGGAKAAAHIGVWEALIGAGIVPSRVVATSMGAVVGAALSAGLAAADVVERIATIGARGVVRHPLAPVGGLYLESLLRGEPLRRAIAELIPARRFADLSIPLLVTTVDLDTGALVAFGPGADDAPLVDVLYASCALPMYFPAAIVGRRRLGDGGLRGVLPFDAAATFPADLVIASDVGPGFERDVVRLPTAVPSMVRAHDDATGILMAANSLAQLALWRADPAKPPLIYVRPRLELNATFRVERAAAYAEEGRRAAAAALAEWRAAT